MAKTKSEQGGHRYPQKMGPPPSKKKPLPRDNSPKEDKVVPRGPFFRSERVKATKDDRKVFKPGAKLNASQIQDRRGQDTKRLIPKPYAGAAPPQKSKSVPNRGMGGH